MDNGNNVQTGGKCILDCNSASTIIFPDNKVVTAWFDDEDALCTDTTSQEILEDGGEYTGYYCT